MTERKVWRGDSLRDYFNEGDTTRNHVILSDIISQTKRDARRQMREECAKVAEQLEFIDGVAEKRAPTQREIAAAIRAMKD